MSFVHLNNTKNMNVFSFFIDARSCSWHNL